MKSFLLHPLETFITILRESLLQQPGEVVNRPPVGVTVVEGELLPRIEVSPRHKVEPGLTVDNHHFGDEVELVVAVIDQPTQPWTFFSCIYCPLFALESEPVDVGPRLFPIDLVVEYKRSWQINQVSSILHNKGVFGEELGGNYTTTLPRDLSDT